MTKGIASPFYLRVTALRVTGADVLALNDLEAFRGARGHVFIRCPAHEDRTPSCSVHLERAYARCFGCGWTAGDVVALHRSLGRFATMGAALSDLERHVGRPIPALRVNAAIGGRGRGSSREVPGRSICVASWTYHESDGAVAFEIHRFQRRLADGTWYRAPGGEKPWKEYRPSHPGGSPRTMPRSYMQGRLRPLFGLPEILAADPERDVFVVEGEPAATAISELGGLATTSSGGAVVPHLSDWRPLAHRRVVIWPDNDVAGEKFARSVAEIIRRANSLADIRLVCVAELGLPASGDVVDWIREGQSHG